MKLAKKLARLHQFRPIQLLKSQALSFAQGKRILIHFQITKYWINLLHIYIDQDGGRPGAIAAGFDAALVDRVVQLVDRAEYKRRQYPPGTKISGKAFGKDRRLPITSHWKES
jgi:NH3-dependent NAD+ synthetase